jgi:hypothetical protein
MAYDGKSQSNMDALGVPPFQETSIIIYGTMDVPGKQMMVWRGFFCEQRVRYPNKHPRFISSF